MSETWINLLLVFIISFLGYHLMPKVCRWWILLLSSIVFFLIASGYKSLLLTMPAVIVAYLGGLYINKTEDERKKKIILTVSILFIITEFIVLKINGIYSQLSTFIADTFMLKRNIVDNLIPIGLSYYSLILIAYITDVYRKLAIPQTNFLKYSLFAMYFPQLSMGPIVRYNDVKDQLYSQKDISFDCIKFGVFRILWGIMKKIVIADRMAMVTNHIIGDYSAFSGGYILLAIVLFGFQFYIDFSAAMDIVLGISECFGIKLPENFNNPLFSKSFHEYWQRWHITLNSFFRDYIFYPVVRSDIVSKIKKLLEKSKWCVKYIPVFIAYIAVWLVAGLWHGMQLKYIIANCLLPCIFMMFEDVFSPYFSKIKIIKKVTSLKIFKPIQMLYVFSFLCICWFFFNGACVNDGILMLKKVIYEFNQQNMSVDLGVDKYDRTVIVLGIILIFIIDIFKELKIDLRKKYINLPVVVRWLIIAVMMVIILLPGLYGPEYNPQDFVYFKF